MTSKDDVERAALIEQLERLYLSIEGYTEEERRRDGREPHPDDDYSYAIKFSDWQAISKAAAALALPPQVSIDTRQELAFVAAQIIDERMTKDEMIGYVGVQALMVKMVLAVALPQVIDVTEAMVEAPVLAAFEKAQAAQSDLSGIPLHEPMTFEPCDTETDPISGHSADLLATISDSRGEIVCELYGDRDVSGEAILEKEAAPRWFATAVNSAIPLCNEVQRLRVALQAALSAVPAGGDGAKAEDAGDRMVQIVKLITDLQDIKERFGNTCVYIRRGGLSWGGVALNRKADDEKNGVFDLQAQHDRDMLARVEQIERLKTDRDSWMEAAGFDRLKKPPAPSEPSDGELREILAREYERAGFGRSRVDEIRNGSGLLPDRTQAALAAMRKAARRGAKG